MKIIFWLLAVSLTQTLAAAVPLPKSQLRDKIAGFWQGQLVGNFMGLPFENSYTDDAIPFLVTEYYSWSNMPKDARFAKGDMRGAVREVANTFQGSWSDDDTDIELVTLHAVEKYGLDLSYGEITEMWKKHINRNIWVANFEARSLMEQGMVAPATGKVENNRHWDQIDPQLVNEIWSAIYAGQPEKAVQRAEWGARITSDSFGTHPTRFYAYMISRAFVDDDVTAMVKDSLKVIPEPSPFREGMVDLIAWKAEGIDWREARERLHKNYYAYDREGITIKPSVTHSLCNGLAGVMAILWGEGEIKTSLGIAVSAGYDCDNQAATVGALLGVLHGAAKLPRELTCGLPTGKPWEVPFNNRYLNYTRDGLPNVFTLDDIIDRTMALTLKAWSDDYPDQ
jgi:ADP-ribosylglycohydrolase